VLLVEEPDADKALVLVLSPAPLAEGASAAGDGAEFALTRLLRPELRRALDENTKGFWSASHGLHSRREARLFYVLFEVDAGSVPGALRAYLDAMGRLGRGEIAAGALDWAKNEVAGWIEGGYDGSRDRARVLGLIPEFDLPLDVRAERYRAALALDKDDVARAAEAHTRRGDLRVLAMGNVAGAKDELEKMGLGKVVLEKAKEDKK
jgi:hypothetical protein